MKKIISILVCVALLVGVYVYTNKNKQQIRCEEGFRFVPSSRQCEPVEKQKESEIDFSKVEIRIDDFPLKIQLEKNDKEGMYTGVLEDAANPSMNMSVSLNSADISKYSEDLVLAPFVLNSGGTGQFVYVGLFDSVNNTHIDSMFIGDRIDVEDIKITESIVRATYKTRLDMEGFASTPSIPAQAVFEIKDKKIIEVMYLQNADYFDIEIKSPVPGAVSTEVLYVKGAIPGSWYFEGSAQFKIVDDQYKEIAFGSIPALSDWMTTQRVPFEIKITTDSLNYTGDAVIHIQSENVRGDEEGEREVKKMSIPIRIK